MRKKHIVLSFIFIIVLSMLFACSDKEGSGGNTDGEADLNLSNNSGNNEEVEGNNNGNNLDEDLALQFPNDDVVVKVATPWGTDYFMSRIGDFVEEKHPHITLEHVDWNGTSENLEELFAEDIVPDVFLAFTGQRALQELDADFALDEMLAAYQIDPETDLKIPAPLLDEIRSRDPDGGLVGIPQERAFYGLYYHEEVFDLFGIPHPDPDVAMTWDEVMSLARQMTTTRDGVNYCGLRFDEWTHEVPLYQLSPDMTDPETGEVLFTSDPKFTRYMELMDNYYSIPGILSEDCGLGERNLAMLISFHGFMAQTWMGGETDEEKIEIYKHIDVVPLPTWSDLPGIDPAPSGVHPWTINSYSEQKDAALQFILAGVSEEYQLQLARDGTPSILQIPEVIEQFGVNNPVLGDKNTKAFFTNTPATPPAKKHVHTSIIGGLPILDFEKDNVDIQQFLRVAQEEAEIKIAEYKANH